jgi:hypothetical protein
MATGNDLTGQPVRVRQAWRRWVLTRTKPTVTRPRATITDGMVDEVPVRARGTATTPGSWTAPPAPTSKIVVVVGAVVAVVVEVSSGIVLVVEVDVDVVVKHGLKPYASPQFSWAEARGAKASRSTARAPNRMPAAELRR